MPFSNQRYQEFLKKWSVIERGQEVRLEHVVVPESEEVHKQTAHGWDRVKGTREPACERAPDHQSLKQVMKEMSGYWIITQNIFKNPQVHTDINTFLNK